MKKQLGGTVNDVVLATVAGALRRFLRRRGENVTRLDFRAMLPVNIRTQNESGDLRQPRHDDDGRSFRSPSATRASDSST